MLLLLVWLLLLLLLLLLFAADSCWNAARVSAGDCFSTRSLQQQQQQQQEQQQQKQQEHERIMLCRLYGCIMVHYVRQWLHERTKGP
jgi:hypothetical protein